MFGLSLTKIIVTILLIVAVWYLFKLYQRKKLVRAEEAISRFFKRDPSPESPSPRSASAAASREAEVLVECRTCGAYVSPRNAVSCGKANCPYPG
jgi:uncharacterized protein